MPKVIKSFKAYFNEDGDLVATYLINQLKEEKYIRDDISLSFYD